MALGPVVGGALVDSVGWRSVFIVNLPIGLAAIVLTALFVPESRAAHPRRIDPVGQVLVIVGAGHADLRDHRGPRGRLAVGPDAGRCSPSRCRAFASLVRLRAAPARAADRDPLLPQRPVLRGDRRSPCALFAAIGGFLFLNTLYLQDVRGLSPLHAGLYMLPMAGVMLVVAPLSGRIVGSFGSRLPLVGGSLGVMASAADPHPADAPHVVHVSGRRLCPVRARLRTRQPAHHQHRGVGDAALAGRASPPPSPPPAARSARRSGSRCSDRSPPGAPPRSGRASRPPPTSAGGSMVGLGAVVLVLAFVTTSAWALATAGRVADDSGDAQSPRRRAASAPMTTSPGSPPDKRRRRRRKR